MAEEAAFWKGFAEFVSRKGTVVKKTHSPRAQQWLGIAGVGRTGFFLQGLITVWNGELKAELQITGQDTDHYFCLLHTARHEIAQEHEFGDELVWYNPDGVQRRSIHWRCSTDFGDPDLRTEQYRWLLDRAEALHRILAPRVKELPGPG